MTPNGPHSIINLMERVPKSDEQRLPDSAPSPFEGDPKSGSRVPKRLSKEELVELSKRRTEVTFLGFFALGFFCALISSDMIATKITSGLNLSERTFQASAMIIALLAFIISFIANLSHYINHKTFISAVLVRRAREAIFPLSESGTHTPGETSTEAGDTSIQEPVESSTIADASKNIDYIDDYGLTAGADPIVRFSRMRLNDHLQSLNRRGNVNLYLGIGVTLVGLIILGLSVYEVGPQFLVRNADDKQVVELNLAVLLSFVPRLSLVLLIEVFAYFFLRLYKAGLDEVRYCENEITNIEMRHLGLWAAEASKDKDALLAVIKSLAETERNHVLSKDQTTVELEKARLENSMANEAIKNVVAVLRPQPSNGKTPS